MTSPTSHPGILHEYAPRLVAFEYAPSSSVRKKPHSLLFVGGLGDGFGTVPYVSELSRALELTEWSLFFVHLSSSYGGWAMGSLDKDIEELAQCVRFVRGYKSSMREGGSGKIVLMGHSTGSQDVLHYLYADNPLQDERGAPQHLPRPEVDGGILQAPVSDREHVLSLLKTGTANSTHNEVYGAYLHLVNFARNQANSSDNVDVVLPLSLTAKLGYPPDVPIGGRRFLSLASPDSPEKPSPDDLFSSDLSDSRLKETFGKLAERGLLLGRLMVLYSEKDEYAPEWVDKENLMQRWKAATGTDKWEDKDSCIIPGANHNVSGADGGPQCELVARVTRYLSRV